MTDHVVRLYALAVSIVVFFVLWATVATHPWQTAAPDPRIAKLAQRETQLRREAVAAKRAADHRFANYRKALAHRQAAAAAALATARTLAAAPAVRIVNLPPLTITRSS